MIVLNVLNLSHPLPRSPPVPSVLSAHPGHTVPTGTSRRTDVLFLALPRAACWYEDEVRGSIHTDTVIVGCCSSASVPGDKLTLRQSSLLLLLWGGRHETRYFCPPGPCVAAGEDTRGRRGAETLSPLVPHSLPRPGLCLMAAIRTVRTSQRFCWSQEHQNICFSFFMVANAMDLSISQSALLVGQDGLSPGP